jgi:hypothetical protein
MKPAGAREQGYINKKKEGGGGGKGQLKNKQKTGGKRQINRQKR